GFHWFAAVGFRAGSALWGLSFQRTPMEGPFEGHDKCALSLLSRKLTEAATLSTLVGRTVITSATAVLDSLRHPWSVIDRSGRVRDSNRSMNSVCDDYICIRQQRLFARDPQARVCLDRLIERLASAPDDAVVETEPVVVRRTTKRPLIIRVLSIPAAARS